MPTKKSMLQAQFVPFSPLPLPEFRDLPLVFWMIAAISLLPALPVQSSSQISHFYRGLSSNSFVTVILPRWTHFDNHPLPIRESPTKGPAVTNMAFRNPPPATSTISYSPYSSLSPQCTSFTHNKNAQPVTTRSCHSVWMPVPFHMLFSLPGILSPSALCIHKTSLKTLKCYLPLKLSLIFSDNLSPPPLPSRTCNTKWQVLIYRSIFPSRLSSLENRLKFHPSPVPYPAPRMKGFLHCP